MTRNSVEEALRLRDRAMAASSCGITIADMGLPDMPLIYINEAFEQITGYSTAETLGRNCRFLQGNDRAQPALTELRAALQQGRSCSVLLRNYHKDGRLFWNELFMSPVFDEASRVTHFVGIQTDVTARVNAEAELRQKKVELEKALADLRETQAMLIHSEKMNALGQMVAGIAHEINNPISFVNSNLHSLRESLTMMFDAYERLENLILSDAEHLSERMSGIRRDLDIDFITGDLDDLMNSSLDGLARVKKIVEALRTFSRVDEAERKLANLHENITSALLIARPALLNRVHVQIEGLEELEDIQCYPAELNQVFLNLILNAAQAIEDRGVLTIRGHQNETHVILEFIDTGSGIRPEIIDQIFNPFFTTKPVGEGTGLGLAISYKIVTDRHQGAIRVESTPGVGSSFILTLPKHLK
ncbi:ATP-binding protein [Geitlerinema splendidum]|jgi:PAS domain S-box-containing protein|nr:ATP-binding protein [Geitlerinema splendidum]